MTVRCWLFGHEWAVSENVGEQTVHAEGREYVVVCLRCEKPVHVSTPNYYRDTDLAPHDIEIEPVEEDE